MIRTACPADLRRILEIYAHARAFMAENGNAGQWGDCFPPEDLLRRDIAAGRLYAVEEDGRVHGVFALIFGPDPTYARIQEGSWLSDSPYGTIHRVAGDGEVRGLFSQILTFCREKTDHLRIDTHADNHVMQHLIVKNGFQRRGMICVEDGTSRIAYEWLR